MRFKTFLLLITLLSLGSGSLFAQNGIAATDDKKESEVKVNLTKEETDGIRIAESTIFVYSRLTGRGGLEQIRKTTVEIGKLTIDKPDNPDGTKNKPDIIDYERKILRGNSLMDEKIRLDQKFPNAEYALVYNGEKTFGVFNNEAFTPTEDAAKSFQNRIWHSLESLLRYKENGARVELEKEEKIMGVDFYVLKMTDKKNRVTTFYVSKKTLRVMMLKYESEGIQYKRKYYDHNYAQGTLVPYNSILWANDKQIEESKISTITYGQPVGEELFVEKKP